MKKELKRLVVFLVIVLGISFSSRFSFYTAPYWLAYLPSSILLFILIDKALRKRNPEGFYIKSVDKGHGDKVIYVLFEYDKSGHRKVIDYMDEQ